jgi:hypothetical protein
MNEHTRRVRRLFAVALALGTLTLASSADLSAQWSLEGRAGSAIPMGDLTDDPGPNQTAGIALAGGAMYTFRTNVSLYAEGSWQQFNCDGCSTDFESWGLDGGLKYVFAESGRALPWARAGVTFQQISAGDGDGEWGVGLDSGVGIDWMLTDRFGLVPALRYDVYSADDLTVSYLTIDLGAHWHVR